MVKIKKSKLLTYMFRCHYLNKPLPSAGVLPWLQGMLCNMQNPCVSFPTPGEAPGQIPCSLSLSGQSIPLYSLLRTNETFSEYLTNNLSVPNTTTVSLMRTKVRLGQVRHPQTDGERDCVFSEDWRRSSISNENQPRGLQNLFCVVFFMHMRSSVSAGDFCRNLTDTLESTSGLRLLWRTFRPFLQGKILYTPDTNVTRSIITEANRTFDALAKVGDLAEAWLQNEDVLWAFFNNGTQINTLRVRAARFYSQDELYRVQMRHAEQGLTGPKNHATLPCRLCDCVCVCVCVCVLQCFDLDKFKGVSTEAVLVEQSSKLLSQDRFWAGLVFTDLDPSDPRTPPHIRYKIRMDIEETERTDKIKERSWSPSARDNPFNDLHYVRGGFVYLQDMVDRGIIKVQTGVSQPLGVYAQQMPYPCYVDDAFLRSLTRSLPLYMTLAWIFSVALIVKGVVQEKEARLKETVRMMGLKSSTYWLSWAISSTLPLAVSAALLTIILKYGKVLRYSDPSVIFVFLLVFCVATVMQCFFISVFFSRANLAAACGGLIYFLLYLPHVLCYAWRDVLGFGAKIATSLLSCVAFGYGCENFSRYEEQGIGIQWSNIRVSPQENDRYSFIVSIFMMLFDAFIYWMLTWYIENVFPGQYGIPKPWYFPFTSSYWCGTPVGSDAHPDLLHELENQSGNTHTHTHTHTACRSEQTIPCYLEKPPPGMKPGVCIRNLVKVYKTGNKLAVDGLSLDFYQDHITSFLGHNGAGKTTTMSILTGLFAPTSGTAYINGYDIRSDMDTIRTHLGMCPQHNVLFNDLTVEEHIYFYARLKGRSSKEVQKEIDQMIRDVGLPHKRKDLVKNLSGGMQRKLSVAIAFVGGSNVVILDEPTAGVDPYARRGIWDLLLKYKTGERNEPLDRKWGECCIKMYGRGYYLTIARANQDRVMAQRAPLIKEVNRRLVRRHVPEAEFLEVVGQELVYVLPYTGAANGSFASLFKELDLEKSALAVTSYGISDTSLEEVYSVSTTLHQCIGLHFTIDSDEQMQLRHCVRLFFFCVTDTQRPMCANGKGSYVIMGWSLIKQQFLALFIKRFHHARRSRRGIIAQVVMPAFFVCLALIFSLIVPPFVEYPNLELQPWMYGAPQNTFYSFDDPAVDQVERVTNALLSSPGFGTRCMTGGTDWFTPAVTPSISEIFEKGNWSMENPSPDCQCGTPQRSIMLPDCPLGAGGLPPPQVRHTHYHTLVKGQWPKSHSVANYCLYGGISVGGVNSQVKLNESDITAVIDDFKSLLNITQVRATGVWFYNQGWHSLVSFLNVASNGVLRGNLPAGRREQEFGITTFNHPLNLTKEQLSFAALATTSTDVVVSICVIFAMSFIPASFVLFLIQERVSKAKHLQFVSGVNPTVYWLANFAWDMCNYIVPCIIVIIIFLCFQQKSYVSPPNLPALILLLVLYGWSITPMMYPASFLFSVPSTAYVVLTCINLFIGINGSVATFVMELFDDPNITRINDIVKQALLVFPHFCLGRGLMDMAKNQAMATLYQNLGEDRFENPLSWNMVGKNLFAMAIQGGVMFSLTLLLQYKFFCKSMSIKSLPTSSGKEDEDVALERERVQRGGAQNDLLRICDLTKVLPCFGLLGINGAGKTTTFKMLTGDISPTAGDAFLNGYSIRSDLQLVQQNMGYCPQFDAIDELLTGREHLEFYARLRGVPEKEVSMVAEWGVQKLGLVKYSEKSAGTYSGGNKRKLSTAIALIGCPPLVFLDEPTTGMDPKARRFLWDCILSVIKEGRSVILTSHSMEECEALCTRMAIMVNGQFKCLGSIQHLKSRFGDGYTLIIRVSADQADLCTVETFVRDTFHGSTLKEKHHNTLQYQIPQGEGALAHIFSQLNKHQQLLHVEDYSVSQTTLDQVFVSFARLQRDEEDGAFENDVDLNDEMQTSAT
uniref:ABC transporter domain-containing protein n=1 Tax=Cyprinus carpio TaxID=7962 RepID=A0A8C1VCG3_CYPCA